jgi:ABC-type phosphate transport system substrate-binding protein
MRTVNRSSLAATLSLSTVVASIFALAPIANAQVATHDAAVQNTNPAGARYVDPAGVQYFANGATSPAGGLRALLDFYGAAVPNTVLNIGQPGSTGIQPFGSPFISNAQFEYCGTGSGNGRATFTGTAQASASCSYVVSTVPGSTRVGPANAPTPLATVPPLPTRYAFQAFPTFSNTVTLGTPSAAPLFAFGDAASSASGLAAADLANYATNKQPTRGNPIQVPVFFSAIAPIVNRAVATPIAIPAPFTTPTLRLTTRQLCGIYDGTITDYASLASTNPGIAAGPIRVIILNPGDFTSVPDGGPLVFTPRPISTTTAFTGYLAAVCNAAGVVTPGYPGYYITAATGTFPFSTAAPIPPSATFVRVVDTESMSDRVSTTSGGLGYVEIGFAAPNIAVAPITNTPSAVQAALQNPVSGDFLTGNVNSIRAGLDNISVAPIDANPTNACILRVSGLPVVPVAGAATPNAGAAYPILTQTYAFFYTNYPTQREVDALQGALNFILGLRTPLLGRNDGIAQSNGLAILGRGSALNTINPLRNQAQSCLLTSKVAVGPN